MGEKYLTLEQNTCAARVFLNTFGLNLENRSDIDYSSKIKIFDKNENEVGELYFDNGKALMVANYNNSVLDASFDIAKMSGFVDLENENSDKPIFGKWSNKISFCVQKQNNTKLSGEFVIGCIADTEFGVSCQCHPLIKCEVPGRGNFTLKILRDLSVLRLDICCGDNYEIIDVAPWDSLNGFFLHEIQKVKYDTNKKAYPYKKCAGIFNGAERGKQKNKLQVFLIEEEYENMLSFRNEFFIKAGDDNSKETLLQKGKLMQDLDPDMFKKIKKLREILLIGDISLLDNLVSVCYDDYTDEELSVLLGLKREKSVYQDGSNNLINSYFGVGKNNAFFPLETQKKLLK